MYSISILNVYIYRQAHALHQVQEELERYKELVATFEASVARKDQLIASLNTSLEKQVYTCTHTPHLLTHSLIHAYTFTHTADVQINTVHLQSYTYIYLARNLVLNCKRVSLLGRYNIMMTRER